MNILDTWGMLYIDLETHSICINIYFKTYDIWILPSS